MPQATATTTAMPAPDADRPLAAAGSILAAMAIIGFIDQFVQLLQDRSSVWTFFVVRAAMMAALAGAFCAVARRRLTVRRWRGVVARSAAMSVALVIYFGSLGFMSVAQAAAGLFTAPIWIMLMSAGLFGLRIGPVRVAAALAGFAGVVLVLSPDPATLGWTSFVPVLAGAFYGLGAIATREWCPGEGALELSLASFAGQTAWSLLAIAVLAATGGGDDFVTRGWVAPDATVLWVCVLQAVGSLIAVTLLTRGYQLAPASVASIFEYSVLGFAALFAWAVWGEATGPLGLLGLALIAGAGAVIALRGRT